MNENNTLKTVAIWAIIALAIVGIIIMIVGAGSGVVTAPTTAELTKPVGAGDHITGTTTPRLVIVEYGDYQCPACAAFQPVVRQIMKDHGNQIELVYRNFPLPQHRNAKASAAAAEAADRQGKFLDMQDKLFATQNDWSEIDNPIENFKNYAQEFGLDINKFGSDMNLPEVQNKIQGDLKSGEDSGVNSTPSFFLNGKKFIPSGKARTLEDAINEFRSAIEKSL